MVLSPPWYSQIRHISDAHEQSGQRGGLVMNFEFESLRTRERDHQAYKEAFDYYDWNKSGTISVKVEKEAARAILWLSFLYAATNVQDLQYVMRRAGLNPTDVEVQDLINKIDNGWDVGRDKIRLVSTLFRSGTLDFDGFLMLMGEKNSETDIEIHYKDTFRAFSKDDDGVKWK